MKKFNILYTPAMRYKIAKAGYEFLGFKLPVGALYGIVSERYHYTPDPIIPSLTIKRVVSCAPVSFIVDDFTPLYYVRDYQEQHHAVFNIRVWDAEHRHWISTNTSTQKYYLLGEHIEEIARVYKILNTRCLYNHLYNKDIQNICGERKNSRYTHSGSTYGYMCKSPDHTCTEYDLIGDQYAENRRFKK